MTSAGSPLGLGARVALLGLGLIGGSLGLALRASRSDLEVVGWDRDQASAALAKERGAIAAARPNPAAAVTDADLVVLCAPVGALRDLIATIGPHVRPGALVTDVASTKAQVAGWARAAGVPFVGGHPMAGSEKIGMVNARLNLFRGAVWLVTPEADAPAGGAEAIEALAKLAGARSMRLDPATHAASVAAISHLPFAACCALVDVTKRQPEWAVMQALAASGYRDATRLASGSTAMYRDICLTNGAAIAPLLRAMAARLSDLADQLDDPVALEVFFSETRAAREAWLAANDRFRLPG